jgi:hypothetical protein
VLGWLTRLFGKRVEAESDSAPVQPATVDVVAAPPPAAGIALSVIDAPVPVSGAPGSLDTAEPAQAKETCPTCGRTSVFAGPPGHRYCMHCALRQELFDASAAAEQ